MKQRNKKRRSHAGVIINILNGAALLFIGTTLIVLTKEPANATLYVIGWIIFMFGCFSLAKVVISINEDTENSN